MSTGGCRVMTSCVQSWKCERSDTREMHPGEMEELMETDVAPPRSFLLPVPYLHTHEHINICSTPVHEYAFMRS